MANNIIKRVWNQNRMVNIEDLSGFAFQAENGGHTFEIGGMDDDGNTVALSGTVAGVFRRPDNADIALTGTASDGVVSVTLTTDCYAVPGRFGLTIFTTANSQKTCVYAAVGTVAQTSGGAVAGDTPQDVVDLINAIEAAIAGIPASYTDIMAAVAPTYSSSAVYPVGAYAWYDGSLYRCTTAITSGETWTAAHWTAASVGGDLASANGEAEVLNSNISAATGIETIPFTLWEIGGISGSSTPPSWGTNNKRARTHQGASISLKAGDIVGLSDYSNNKYAFGGQKADSTWYYSGSTFLTSHKEVTEDLTSCWFLIIKSGTETVLTDPYLYGKLLFIHRFSSAQADTVGDVFENKKHILNTESVTLGKTDLEIGGVTVESNALSYAYNKNRVRLKQGLTFSLNVGDKVSLTSTGVYRFILYGKKTDSTYFTSATISDSLVCGYNLTDCSLAILDDAGGGSETTVTDLSNYYGLIKIERVSSLGNSFASVSDVVIENAIKGASATGFIKLPATAFESGGFTFSTSSGPSRATNTSSIRLKQGITFDLNQGDQIILSSYSDYYARFTGKKSDNTWGYTSITSDYTSNNNYTDCVLQIIKSDSTVIDDYNTVAALLTIVKKKKNENTTPILTVIDDDTVSVAHVTKFYNACNHSSLTSPIKGTFACITKYPRNNSSLKTLLQEYEDDGFQIVYHCDDQQTYYQNATDPTAMAQVEDNFATGLRYIHSIDILNPDLWVTPYGAHSAPLQGLAKKRGMKCLVSIAQNAFVTNTSNTSRWFIPRIGLNQTDSAGSVSLAQLKTAMENCAAANGWLLIGTHFNEWTINAGSSPDGYERFVEAINYALSLGFEVKTLGEAYEIFAPLLSN